MLLMVCVCFPVFQKYVSSVSTFFKHMLQQLCLDVSKVDWPHETRLILSIAGNMTPDGKLKHATTMKHGSLMISTSAQQRQFVDVRRGVPWRDPLGFNVHGPF